MKAPAFYKRFTDPNYCAKMQSQEAMHFVAKAYLHMATWGTDDYAKLDPADRAEFVDALKCGELVDWIQNMKALCLVKGVPMRDHWLTDFSAAEIRDGEPLPAATRKRLESIAHEMYAQWQREDAAVKAAQTEDSTGIKQVMLVLDERNRSAVRIVADKSMDIKFRGIELLRLDPRFLEMDSIQFAEVLGEKDSNIRGWFKKEVAKARQWWADRANDLD